MAKQSSSESQPRLFPDYYVATTGEQSPDDGIFTEVNRPTTPLSIDSEEYPTRSSDVGAFVLSRRWEQCADVASRRDNYEGLLSIVRPITSAQNQLIDYINLMKTTEEGALWVFYGSSGSGKTTFLSTLEHQFNQGQEVLQAVVLKADELALSNRNELRVQLFKVINARKSVNVALVLVLEDREDSIDEAELSSLTQTLKGLLRSPKTGKNVLVVFPVNNSKNGRRIIDAAQDVGIQQHEGARSTIFTFDGPDPSTFVDIVEALAQVLNGRPLSSFGVSRHSLENMPKDRKTLGNFIQEVAERIQGQERRMFTLLQQSRYKELTTIFVFVRPLEPTTLYTDTQQMVVDNYNRINMQWLLTDGSELNTREWKNAPERFATIVNGVLHTRVVEFPPHVLYQILQVYGTENLKAKLADAIRTANLDPTPTKNQANSRQAVDATNLAKLLCGEAVRRPSKTVIDEDELDPQPSENTQQKQNLIRKGIVTAEWIPTLPSVYPIHSTIARAFKDLITRGNLRTRIPGYMGVWAETTLALPDAEEPIRTVKPDITVESNKTLYLIEFNFGASKSLTRADMSNYILRKLSTYSQQLPLLRQISQS